MIKNYIIIAFLTFCLGLEAQQDLQFTQFATTKLNYNPAVAGVEDNFSATARHRNQWSGIQGSPLGQSLIIDFPLLHNSLGFGLAINRATIGIQEKTDLTGMYSYKLKLSSASLSLGLQFSIRQFINDFSKEGLIAIDGFEKDPSLSRDKFSKSIFNLGLGVYLKAPRYYVGLSLPRSVTANIDSANDNALSKEVRHLYTMFGLNFSLSPTWIIKPNILLKLLETAPFDLDIQNSFIYQDQVHLGFNIRTGGTQSSLFESFAFLIGFQFTPTIFASMSYDFNTTNIRQYEEGSFEVLIMYRKSKDRAPKNIQNPRYF